MLLVVSPNLAIDRILEVARFRAGEVHRSRTVITQAGGKGSNVARVFRQLGGDVVLIGFAGRGNVQRISEPLRSAGIHVEAIEAYDGESRTCTIICDSGGNDHPTVINEESPQVEEKAIETMHHKIDEWFSRVRAVLVTGSLSRGLPDTFYASVIQRALRRCLVSAIDASGTVMRQGLQAAPTIAKATVQELTAALGPLGNDPHEIVHSLRGNSELPAQLIVTLGESGALLFDEGRTWLARPPRISHVNPIGAGDSFAAGYLKACLDGSSPDVALRFASAVAALDAATREPGKIDVGELSSAVSETNVTPVD